ncbi:MAG: 4a-hydroxytetrahydrobiopterin dehydratase [Pseudomonadota bacterium]
MSQACELGNKRCKPCEGGVAPLSQTEIDSLMSQLPGWKQHNQVIGKDYHFKDYYQTIAFVNAVAWMTHRENHHPDLSVGYNACRVEYTTHAIGGLSDNDFICAAKVDALREP